MLKEPGPSQEQTESRKSSICGCSGFWQGPTPAGLLEGPT